MLLTVLKSKINPATVTASHLWYDGSLTIDQDLMDAAGILPDEQIHVLNLNNGTRIITYVIEAPAGSGTMLLNGPAARLGEPGDQVIVISYCAVSDEEARTMTPKIVKVDGENRILPE